MSESKYTRELLEPIVKQCKSMHQVLKMLDLKLSGGMHKFLKERIVLLKLDTSHWLGKRANRGVNHHGSKKLSFIDILVFDRLNGRRENVFYIRRALIQSGIKEKCELCSITNEWNGKFLRLQIDHINGNFLDNTKENLRFLCPNCHSQTSTFSGNKNRATVSQLVEDSALEAES